MAESRGGVAIRIYSALCSSRSRRIGLQRRCSIHLALDFRQGYKPGVFIAKPDRPYLESWLCRTRRLLSVSGRLSELALILAKEEEGTPEHWHHLVREILEEKTTPSLDLLMKIDAVLAKPVATKQMAEQLSFF
jgi:hypothetical protein